MQNPVIVCLDLEGVLVPEIWVNFAIKPGIEELKVTTREMPNYDALMTRRLEILDQHGFTIAESARRREAVVAPGIRSGFPARSPPRLLLRSRTRSG